MTRDELLAEAQRRGLQQAPSAAAASQPSVPDKAALLTEAKRRGLDKKKPSQWNAIRKGLAEGLTFGWSDEINSLMPANVISGQRAAALERGDRETQELRKAYPGTMLLSEVVGGLPTAGAGGAVALGAKAMRGATPFVRGMTGVATGAVEGALSGAGHADPNDGSKRLGPAVLGGAAGGVLGGAMVPVASGVRRVVDRAASRTPEGAAKVAENFIDAQIPHGTSKLKDAMSVIRTKSFRKPKPTGAERFEEASELAQAGATVAAGGIPYAQIAKRIGKAFTGHPNMPHKAKIEMERILDETKKAFDDDWFLSDKEGIDMLFKMVPDEARKPLRDYLTKNAGGLVFGATTPAMSGAQTRK